MNAPKTGDGATLQLIARAIHRVAPEADLGTVDAGAAIQRELDLDSMDFLNFVTELQELTGVDIPERDYPRLATVGGCVDYLSSLSSAERPWPVTRQRRNIERQGKGRP